MINNTIIVISIHYIYITTHKYNYIANITITKCSGPSPIFIYAHHTHNKTHKFSRQGPHWDFWLPRPPAGRPRSIFPHTKPTINN